MALYHEIIATWIRRKWQREQLEKMQEGDSSEDQKENKLLDPRELMIINGESGAGRFEEKGYSQ